MYQTGNDLKIAQLAGYLLTLAGGKMHKIKLMTLLYLADRYALKHHKMQLTNDAFISTQNGPALAHTRMMMNGEVLSNDWNLIIHAEANHEVSCHSAIVSFKNNKDIEAIAIEALNNAWAEYGKRTLATMVLFTKNDLKEWRMPQYGLIEKLPLKNVLTALGYEETDAKALARKITAKNNKA